MNQPPAEPPCVLVVDDEAPIRRLVRRLLAQDPCVVELAEDGPAALEILARRPVAVVLADHHMPGMLGVDLLRLVVERSPATSRILFSGHVDVGLIRTAVNAGEVYRFITKPWSDEELLLAIRHGIERWRLVVENEALQARNAAQNEELRHANATLSHLAHERGEALTVHDRALRMSQEVLDHLPVATIGIDPGGVVVLANIMASATFPALTVGEAAAAALPAALADWMGDPERAPRLMLRLPSGTWAFEAVRLDQRGLVVAGHPQLDHPGDAG